MQAFLSFSTVLSYSVTHRPSSMTALCASPGSKVEKVGIIIIDHGSRVARANDMLLEVFHLHDCTHTSTSRTSLAIFTRLHTNSSLKSTRNTLEVK